MKKLTIVTSIAALTLFASTTFAGNLGTEGCDPSDTSLMQIKFSPNGFNSKEHPLKDKEKKGGKTGWLIYLSSEQGEAHTFKISAQSAIKHGFLYVGNNHTTMPTGYLTTSFSGTYEAKAWVPNDKSHRSYVCVRQIYNIKAHEPYVAIQYQS